MKKFTLILFLIMAVIEFQGQSYEITFAGIGTATVVDSVKVENLTQGISASLGGSDTLNLLLTVGMKENDLPDENSLVVCPNPSSGAYLVTFRAKSAVNFVVGLYDLTGKRIFQTGETAEEGENSFYLDGLKNGVYLLKITSSEFSYSGKLIRLNSQSSDISFRYNGKSYQNGGLKDVPPGTENREMKNISTQITMPYTPGDILKFRGESGIYRAITMLVPSQSQVVTFLFVKCTDADDNHYATVQIGSQIWMAENLKAGAMINGIEAQTNNGIIERYCYDDNVDNCEVYGALYQWNELMEYDTARGGRGICPQGWHIPTDPEWANLIDYLGGDAFAGGKMKETGYDHWAAPNTGATDASGFEALPGGSMESLGTFLNVNYAADFWSSTQNSTESAWNRFLIYDSEQSGRNEILKSGGRSCRCIQDHAIELTMLAGDTSKTWKLLRDVSTGRYPLEVGPEDHSTIWWAMGLNNNELANRPCMLNDRWTFGRDESLIFETLGDYWAEGGIFQQTYVCASTESMVGINGDDLSAWGDGNHTYKLSLDNAYDITSMGLGAYIGFYKLGNDEEVMLPQDSVRYDIIKLSDDQVDTLIVEGTYHWDPNTPGGYWRFVLVHYDNPDEEPPMPGNLPIPSFNMIINGNTVICTNTSQFCDSYLWDFGDGTTYTTINATHTYALDGYYEIVLTGMNALDTNSFSQGVFVNQNSPPLTNAMLQGDPWRVVVGEWTVFVGPGMGNSSWWHVPVDFLNGTATGTNDWSCMPDDEFTFSAGGVYTYNTMGTARNDGYFGYPQGCWTDAQIAASGNGAAFGSATHSYSFTPATGNSRAILNFTNGTGHAAFIGFYKGYYGGENADPYLPPNGGYPTNRWEVMGYAVNPTHEYLEVSVDISPDHTESASWTVILER